MESPNEEVLCAEIGRFVIEFEGLLQITKDTIQKYFRKEKLEDTVPVEILMFDSTSSPISHYFKAISIHYLNVKHSDKKEDDVKKIKKYVNFISSHLLEAGELRNDVVHSTWYLSSVYGTNAQLEANKVKVTGDGIVMRKFFVKPGILDDSLTMIRTLSYFIEEVGAVISHKSLAMDHYLSDESVSKFNKIDFKKERKNLFADDLQHYENELKRRRELDEIFKEDD